MHLFYLGRSADSPFLNANPMETRPDILVVDDEPSHREVLALTIESGGYAVATAGDGFEAIDVVAEWGPRLVITDIHMPRMSGEALTNELVRRHEERCPPVVAITSDEDAATNLASDERYRAVLTKPLDPIGLLALIAEILD